MFKPIEIGIDLGTKEIKIAEVHKVVSINNDLNHLKNYKAYPVNCEAYSNEYFNLLRNSIKDFAKENKMSSLSLNFSMPINKHSNVIFINMPTVDKKDLETGIKFEAEQALALKDIKNAEFTWKISNEFKELHEYEILLATINSKIVKSLTQFKTIQWKINRVMLQPVLLERFARDNDIIIDFGHTHTRVYMYKEGKLAGVDSVNIGGHHIMNKIEDYVEIHNINIDEFLEKHDVEDKEDIDDIEFDKSSFVDDEEDDYEDEIDYEGEMQDVLDELVDTEEINSNDEVQDDYEDKTLSKNHLFKKQRKNKIEIEEVDGINVVDLLSKLSVLNDFVNEDDEFLLELSKEIKVPINTLFDELKRIIRAFELQNGLSIDSLYYTGELANLRYFTQVLEAELDLELTQLNILNKEVESSKYELAGLSMLDAKMKDDTNFIKFVKANVDYTSLLIAALTISLSMGVAFKHLDKKYTSVIYEQDNERSQQMTTLSGLESDIDYTQSSIDRSETFMAKIEAIKNEKKWLSDILYVVPSITPTTITITDMNIVDKQVRINGLGADYSAVGFFIAELEKIGEVNLEMLEGYEGENNVYSVIAKNVKNTSKKYLMTQQFELTLDYEVKLLDHE